MKVINKFLAAGALCALAAPSQAQVLKEELAARVNNEPITVTEYKRAKEALNRFGAAFDWHDIEQEDGAADKAVEISGQKHIPVVQYADGSFQVEPSANDIKAKLQELGALPAEA